MLLSSEILDEREVGNSENYGYDALRVYRQGGIDLHTEMCNEAGIPVVYEKQYTQVVSESEKEVTITFEDGEQKTHGLLVGADGIHSVVRKYPYPERQNMYAGRVAVAALAPSSPIKKPFPNYPLPASINGAHGHINIHPLGSSDSVCPVATTRPLRAKAMMKTPLDNSWVSILISTRMSSNGSRLRVVGASSSSSLDEGTSLL